MRHVINPSKKINDEKFDAIPDALSKLGYQIFLKEFNVAHLCGKCKKIPCQCPEHKDNNSGSYKEANFYHTKLKLPRSWQGENSQFMPIKDLAKLTFHNEYLEQIKNDPLTKNRDIKLWRDTKETLNLLKSQNVDMSRVLCPLAISVDTDAVWYEKVQDLYTRGNYGLTIHLIKNLFGQLLLAVESFHKNGLAHRDIKLENVFLFAMNANQYDLVIGDLDFVCVLGRNNTTLQIPVGTPDYTAPEVMRILLNPNSKADDEGQHYSKLDQKAVDMYACGESLGKLRFCLPGLQRLAYPDLNKLIGQLKDPNPKRRLTATSAQNHPFFGLTKTLRKEFFNNLKMKRTRLSIDGYSFNETPKPGDMFYLLPSSIKSFHCSWLQLHNQIMHLQQWKIFYNNRKSEAITVQAIQRAIYIKSQQVTSDLSNALENKQIDNVYGNTLKKLKQIHDTNIPELVTQIDAKNTPQMDAYHDCNRLLDKLSKSDPETKRILDALINTIDTCEDDSITSVSAIKLLTRARTIIATKDTTEENMQSFTLINDKIKNYFLKPNTDNHSYYSNRIIDIIKNAYDKYQEIHQLNTRGCLFRSQGLFTLKIYNHQKVKNFIKKIVALQTEFRLKNIDPKQKYHKLIKTIDNHISQYEEHKTCLSFREILNDNLRKKLPELSNISWQEIVNAANETQDPKLIAS